MIIDYLLKKKERNNFQSIIYIIAIAVALLNIIIFYYFLVHTHAPLPPPLLARPVFGAAYVPVRTIMHLRPKVLLTRDQLLGLTREWSIAITLPFLFRQYRRSSTIDELLSGVYVRQSDSGSIFVLYRRQARRVVRGRPRDRVHRGQQASYAGPSNYKELSPADFEFNILGPAGAKRDWIVFFHASWSTQCVNMLPMFGQLSVKYGTDHLKFATFDVGRWATFVDRHNLKVDATVSSLQLPTFALYEKSSESRRLPPFDKKGGVTTTYIDAAGCVSYFDLERRLEMGKDYKPARSSAAKKKKSN